MKPAPARLHSIPPCEPAGPSPAANQTAPISPRVIDEFSLLHSEVQSLNARLRVLQDEKGTYAKLKAQIEKYCDVIVGVDNRVLLPGLRFDLEATPRQNEKTPDKSKLYRFFGVRRFLNLVEISQRKIKEGLAEMGKPESMLGDFLSEARTGYRKYTVLSKEKAA